MDLNEAASLLGISKERAQVAIREGIELPISKDRISLTAVQLQHGYDISQEDLEAFILAFEKQEPGRHPPAVVRRELLIEVGYKCGVCRESAPLEFHHIIEWNRFKHHDPNHMLAVCANCHGKITRYGEPDFPAQKQIKERLRSRIDPAKANEQSNAQSTPLGDFHGTSNSAPMTHSTSDASSQVFKEEPSMANGESRTEIDPKVLEHDRNIFREGENILGEKSLYALLQQLGDDHSFYMYPLAATRRFVEHFDLESNRFITNILLVPLDTLCRSLCELNDFLGKHFFLYPRHRQPDPKRGVRQCLYPEYNTDRGGSHSAEGQKRYSSAARDLQNVINAVESAYREYRRTVKNSLVI